MVYTIASRRAERRRSANLKGIWLASTDFAPRHRTPPADVAELAASERVYSWPPAEHTSHEIEAGSYTVVWKEWRILDKATGYPLSCEAPASREIIIAFEKQVPENGGYVIRYDGSVATMTAADFRKAIRESSP